MTGRLTDELWAECERIAERLNGRSAAFAIDASDLMGAMDCIPALVAEVRKHRAACTLADDEQEHLDAARWEVGDHRGLHRPLALSLLAIIDRLTDEAHD